MRRTHPQHFNQMLPLFQIVTPRFKSELDRAQQRLGDLADIPIGPDITQYSYQSRTQQQSRRRGHRRRHHHLEVGVHRTHKKPAASSSSNFHKHSFSANFPAESKKNENDADDDIYYNIEEGDTHETRKTRHEAVRKKRDPDENGERATDKDGIEIPTLETIYRDDENFDSHVKTTELILDQVAQIASPDEENRTRVKKKQLVKENVKLLEENKRLFENMELIERKLVDKEVQLSGLYERIEQIKYANKEIVEENLFLRNRIQEPCVKCVDSKQFREEFDKCKDVNRTLQRDLEMLKNVVYRLNVELERHQELLRNRRGHETATTMEEDDAGTRASRGEHVAASWGDVNSHTLGPLLDAYQDAVTEKEDIIRTYQREIDDFTGRLKRVVAENETLHKKIVDDGDAYAKRESRIVELGDENRLLREQNGQLAKKSDVVENKMKDLMRMYEQKVESMSRDYDTLHSQYHKSRTDFCTLQGKYQILIENVDKQKKDNEHVVPIDVHNETLKEYKRLLEDSRAQHESERLKLEQRIREIEQRGPELENRIVELRAEKRELQINAKSLQQTIKKLQLRHEQTHANLVASQVAKETCRKQLQRAYEFSRDLVHEQETLLAQLADKQRENRQMQIAGIGVGVVSKLDSFRTQLKSIQRDATQSFESVEHRDASVEALRMKFDREIEMLSKNLNKKDEIIASMQQQKEDARKGASITVASCLMYKDRTAAGGDG